MRYKKWKNVGTPILAENVISADGAEQLQFNNIVLELLGILQTYNS
jgi:hypothetical protein